MTQEAYSDNNITAPYTDGKETNETTPSIPDGYVSLSEQEQLDYVPGTGTQAPALDDMYFGDGLVHEGSGQKTSFNPIPYLGYGLNLKTDADIDYRRAIAQPMSEQIDNMAMQMGLGEAVGGTVQTVGSLVGGAAELGGVVINKMLGEAVYDTDTYTNAIVELGTSITEHAKANNPIYRERPNAAFAFGDSGWWTSSAVSVASTVGMILPSMAVVKGFGALGKALKLNKILKLSDRTLDAIKVVSTAGIQRNGENVRESLDTVNRLKSDNYRKFMEDPDVYNDYLESEQGKALTSRMEDEGKEVNEKTIAEQIAGEAGWLQYKTNAMNLGFDIVQVGTLYKMFGGARGIFNGAKKLSPAVRRAHLKNIGRYVAPTTRMGKLSIVAKDASYIFRNPLGLGGAMAGEGAEEFINGVAQKKAMLYGKYLANEINGDEFTSKDRIEAYSKDPHVWEQVMWGAIGGGVFHSGAKGLSMLTVNQKKDPQSTYNAIQAIEGRTAQADAIKKASENIMSGINPAATAQAEALDPKASPVMYTEDDIARGVQQEDMLALVTNAIRNMSISHSVAGIESMFDEFIDSATFNGIFEDANTMSTDGESLFNRQFFKDIHDITSKSYSTIMEGTFTGGFDNAVRREAFDKASTELTMAHLYETLSAKYKADIAKMDSTGTIDKHAKAMYAVNANQAAYTVLLDKKKNLIRALAETSKLSPKALQYKFELARVNAQLNSTKKAMTAARADLVNNVNSKHVALIEELRTRDYELDDRGNLTSGAKAKIKKSVRDVLSTATAEEVYAILSESGLLKTRTQTETHGSIDLSPTDTAEHGSLSGVYKTMYDSIFGGNESDGIVFGETDKTNDDAFTDVLTDVLTETAQKHVTSMNASGITDKTVSTLEDVMYAELVYGDNSDGTGTHAEYSRLQSRVNYYDIAVDAARASAKYVQSKDYLKKVQATHIAEQSAISKDSYTAMAKMIDVAPLDGFDGLALKLSAAIRNNPVFSKGQMKKLQALVDTKMGIFNRSEHANATTVKPDGKGKPTTVEPTVAKEDVTLNETNVDATLEASPFSFTGRETPVANTDNVDATVPANMALIDNLNNRLKIIYELVTNGSPFTTDKTTSINSELNTAIKLQEQIDALADTTTPTTISKYDIASVPVIARTKNVNSLIDKYNALVDKANIEQDSAIISEITNSLSILATSIDKAISKHQAANKPKPATKTGNNMSKSISKLVDKVFNFIELKDTTSFNVDSQNATNELTEKITILNGMITAYNTNRGKLITLIEQLSKDGVTDKAMVLVIKSDIRTVTDDQGVRKNSRFNGSDYVIVVDELQPLSTLVKQLNKESAVVTTAINSFSATVISKFDKTKAPIDSITANDTIGEISYDEALSVSNAAFKVMDNSPALNKIFVGFLGAMKASSNISPITAIAEFLDNEFEMSIQDVYGEIPSVADLVSYFNVIMASGEITSTIGKINGKNVDNTAFTFFRNMYFLKTYSTTDVSTNDYSDISEYFNVEHGALMIDDTSIPTADEIAANGIVRIQNKNNFNVNVLNETVSAVEPGWELYTIVDNHIIYVNDLPKAITSAPSKHANTIRMYNSRIADLSITYGVTLVPGSTVYIRADLNDEAGVKSKAAGVQVAKLINEYIADNAITTFNGVTITGEYLMNKTFDSAIAFDVQLARLVSKLVRRKVTYKRNNSNKDTGKVFTGYQIADKAHLIRRVEALEYAQELISKYAEAHTNKFMTDGEVLGLISTAFVATGRKYNDTGLMKQDVRTYMRMNTNSVSKTLGDFSIQINDIKAAANSIALMERAISKQLLTGTLLGDVKLDYTIDSKSIPALNRISNTRTSIEDTFTSDEIADVKFEQGITSIPTYTTPTGEPFMVHIFEPTIAEVGGDMRVDTSMGEIESIIENIVNTGVITSDIATDLTDVLEELMIVTHFTANTPLTGQYIKINTNSNAEGTDILEIAYNNNDGVVTFNENGARTTTHSRSEFVLRKLTDGTFAIIDASTNNYIVAPTQDGSAIMSALATIMGSLQLQYNARTNKVNEDVSNEDVLVDTLHLAHTNITPVTTTTADEGYGTTTMTTLFDINVNSNSAPVRINIKPTPKVIPTPPTKPAAPAKPVNTGGTHATFLSDVSTTDMKLALGSSSRSVAELLGISNADVQLTETTIDMIANGDITIDTLLKIILSVDAYSIMSTFTSKIKDVPVAIEASNKFKATYSSNINAPATDHMLSFNKNMLLKLIASDSAHELIQLIMHESIHGAVLLSGNTAATDMALATLSDKYLLTDEVKAKFIKVYGNTMLYDYITSDSQELLTYAFTDPIIANIFKSIKTDGTQAAKAKNGSNLYRDLLDLFIGKLMTIFKGSSVKNSLLEEIVGVVIDNDIFNADVTYQADIEQLLNESSEATAVVDGELEDVSPRKRNGGKSKRKRIGSIANTVYSEALGILNYNDNYNHKIC